jgi:hypothetical protein
MIPPLYGNIHLSALHQLCCIGMAPGHRACRAWHAAPASGDRAGLRARSGMQLADKTELWSPHRVQCSLVLVAGRDRALGTGQSWGAPRRHAGHCALYVHCGARIGYSVEGGDVGCEDPSGPPRVLRLMAGPLVSEMASPCRSSFRCGSGAASHTVANLLTLFCTFVVSDVASGVYACRRLAPDSCRVQC